MNIDLSTVNWELLRSQKRLLIELETGNKTPPLVTPDIEKLSGLINLLDNIQDQAAKELGNDLIFKDT